MQGRCWATVAWMGIGLCSLHGCEGSSAVKTETAIPQNTPAAESAATEVPDPTPAPPGQTEGAVAPPGPTSGKVDLQVLSWDQMMALVEQQKGKVVVVDVWATYCVPCIREFPNLVKLHQEHPQQVAAISVSLDYEGFEGMPPEAYREKVLTFLQKQKATMTNVLCSDDPESLYGQKLPQQSLPAVLVYDKQGQLAGRFPDPQAADPEFTYAADVLPLVDKLISAD